MIPPRPTERDTHCRLEGMPELDRVGPTTGIAANGGGVVNGCHDNQRLSLTARNVEAFERLEFNYRSTSPPALKMPSSPVAGGEYASRCPAHRGGRPTLTAHQQHYLHASTRTGTRQALPLAQRIGEHARSQARVVNWLSKVEMDLIPDCHHDIIDLAC